MGALSALWKRAQAALLLVLVMAGCNRTSNLRRVDAQLDAGSEEADAAAPSRRTWVTVSGKVAGLKEPIELGLRSPSSELIERIPVSSNGTFEFTEPVKIGQTYAVEVSEQPAEGFCAIANASGTVRTDVTDVEVTCLPENPGISAIDATIGSLSPAFDPEHTRYRLDVFAWVDRVGVSPQLADNNARVYLGEEEYRGKPLWVDLPPGQTTIRLDVDLPDGDQRSFTVDIYRPTRVVEESYAKATQPVEGAQYSYALGLNRAPELADGALLAVGAPGHPSKTQTINGPQTELGASLSGAVFLYGRDEAGSWREQAFIKANNAEAEDLFGLSVALEGELLVVGAPEEDGESGGVNGPDGNDAPGSGAVYVFRRRDEAWHQEAYLKAEFPAVADGFGRSVALDYAGGASRIAVGAWHDSNSAVGTNPKLRDTAASNSGAAYVFEYRDGGWEQVSYLKPSNTDFADSFGEAIAIAGDTLVVGAPLESGAVGKINGDQANNDAFAAGAAYVFEYDAGNDAWYQRSYLKPNDVRAEQRFGNAVAVQRGTVVVGSFTEPNSATGVNSDIADEVAEESGAVYVFANVDDEWTQQAYLKASNTGSRDRFGHALALFGETLVVGAPLEASAAGLVSADQADDEAPGAGAAYVFSRSGETWRFDDYLKASNPEAGDNFGAAVAFDGKHVVIGAPYEDGAIGGTTSESGPNNASIAAGAFYVFR